MSAEVLTLPQRRIGERHQRLASPFPLDLSRPDSIERLNHVASDWLFEECSPDGRRKLLEQHELLAA